MSATLGAAARRRLVPYYDVHGPWSSMLVGNRNGGKASGKIWREGQLSDDGEFVDGQTIGQLTGEFIDGQTIGQLTGEFIDGQTIGQLTGEFIDGQTIGQLTGEFVDGQTHGQLTGEFVDGQTHGQLTGEFVDEQTIKYWSTHWRVRRPSTMDHDQWQWP
jgi:hypothetical protein